MRKVVVGVIAVIVAMCLMGCGGKTRNYQEINITETDSVSDWEGAPENDQEVLAKGYDLPTAQSDIDKAEKETEDLLDCIETMYLPYLDDETPIPEDVDIKKMMMGRLH